MQILHVPILVQSITPGLIAVIGNIIIYLFIKSRIDKSIEKYKIIYSGVYKEKIEIYKSLLKKIFELKFKIQQYLYTGREDLTSNIALDFNEMIIFYQINQPYLSESVINNLKKIINELQDCYDASYIGNNLNKIPVLDNSVTNDSFNKFLDSFRKMKANHPFIEIESIIINEMRNDLQIDKIS